MIIRKIKFALTRLRILNNLISVHFCSIFGWLHRFSIFQITDSLVAGGLNVAERNITGI